jgi:hypothetical protein
VVIRVLGKDEIRLSYLTSICNYTEQVKVKLSLCFFLTEHHAMKMYWGSGCIAPHILDLSTRWRWVVSFTSQPLYPQGKSPWYPLDRRLGGPKSQSGCSGEEKNFQPLLGLESLINYTEQGLPIITMGQTYIHPSYGWNVDTNSGFTHSHYWRAISHNTSYQWRSDSYWPCYSISRWV